MDIAIKSTGFLVDEMLTAELKIAAGNEQAQDRRHDLGNKIMERLGDRILDKEFSEKFWNLVNDLRLTLIECWNFQEIIFKYKNTNYSFLTEQAQYDLIIAARGAQTTNAIRCRFIREIDTLVEESEITVLEKTYA